MSDTGRPARLPAAACAAPTAACAAPTAACAAPTAAQVPLPALRPDVLDPAGAALWMSTGVLLAGCAVGPLLDRLVWTS